MKWFDIPDELLPPVFRRIKDMYAYARTLDTELREFLLYVKRILDNFFVQTCDLQTIEYWEQLLNIHLYGDETIEERRQNILLYLNNSSPTTEPYVREVLTRLFGEDNYDLYFDLENNKPYNLNIEIRDTDINSINKFMFWFTRMCPAHILLNAQHVETSEEDNCIYMGAQSDYLSVAVLTVPSPNPNNILVDNNGKIVGGLNEGIKNLSLGMNAIPDGSIVGVGIGTVNISEPDLVIVEQPEPPVGEHIDVLLGLYVNSFNVPTQKTFPANGYLYAGLLNATDEQAVLDFGCNLYYGDLPAYGEMKYEPEHFTYEPLALYADAAGTELNTDDMSNFYCSTSGTQNSVLTINSINAYSTLSRTWLCRITKLV